MNQRILLIDDEPDLRENTAALLAFEGYIVDTATNGQEGLEKAQQERPDLIICDIMMPVMSGLELVERIRQIPGLKTIPFIFFSAKVTAFDIRYGMKLGADDYLPKPFTANDLIESVASRLARSQAIREEIHDRIRQTKAMLKEVVAHEYNTPLSGIIGASYLLTDLNNPISKEETVLLANEMVQASWRLKRTLDNATLANQLLNDTVATGLIGYTIGTCGITHKLLWSIANDVSQRYDSGQQVELKIDAAELPVNEQALKKCLEEIIDNGFKFSGPGHCLYLTGTYSDDGSYSLSVRNEGRLFEADDIARIDAYQQFNRKQYEQQGLGVGLFIVRKLWEANGGQLLIKSTLETGTCVTLYFPTNQ